jgi:hypothetical protein
VSGTRSLPVCLMRFSVLSEKWAVKVHPILCDDVIFLSRVITGVESWIYGYDPETKQQPYSWKYSKSPRLKYAWHVKSKYKSALFFDIKGIVHEKFILAGETVDSTCYFGILQLTAWKCANISTRNLATRKLAVTSRQHTPFHTSFFVRELLAKNSMTVVPTHLTFLCFPDWK